MHLTAVSITKISFVSWLTIISVVINHHVVVTTDQKCQIHTVEAFQEKSLTGVQTAIHRKLPVGDLVLTVSPKKKLYTPT